MQREDQVGSHGLDLEDPLDTFGRSSANAVDAAVNEVTDRIRASARSFEWPLAAPMSATRRASVLATEGYLDLRQCSGGVSVAAPNIVNQFAAESTAIEARPPRRCQSFRQGVGHLVESGIAVPSNRPIHTVIMR
jgi:hypothetical protein